VFRSVTRLPLPVRKGVVTPSEAAAEVAPSLLMRLRELLRCTPENEVLHLTLRVEGILRGFGGDDVEGRREK
jgi:hypothetical protein